MLLLAMLQYFCASCCGFYLPTVCMHVRCKVPAGQNLPSKPKECQQGSRTRLQAAAVVVSACRKAATA
jgi:hypothetical protein